MDGFWDSFCRGALERLWWLTLAALSIFLIVKAVTVVYNVFFHPLRHFPGPWLAAATPLPYVYQLCSGKLPLWADKLHQKYGEVVRAQPDELFFITASAWHDIYQSRPELPKPEIGAFQPINGVRPVAGLTNIDDHKRQRHVLNPAFSDRALREQHYILQYYTDSLIKRLTQVSKLSEVDIRDWYMFTTVDIITDLSFGKSFNCLVSGEHHPWVGLIYRLLKAVQVYASLSYLSPLDTIIDYLIPSFMRKRGKEHFAYIVRQVDERMERKTDRPDIMKFILENNPDRPDTKQTILENDKPYGMNKDEIDSTMRAMVLAGSETSSTTMTSTTWFLLKNTFVREKLVKEIRNAFTKYEDINVTSTSHLPYLHAVIEEAMRLHPPLPSSRPRLVDRHDVVISGRPVPAGTRVGVPQKAAYRSAANFVEPLSFIPERWLPESDPQYSADEKQVFHPFMVGNRNCLGQKLAWAEIKLTLCKVFWCFDIELTANNQRDWADQRMYHLHERTGLDVRLTPSGLPLPA